MTYGGMRVTDAVTYFQKKQELRGSLHVVRVRTPDRLRWRKAVGTVTAHAAPLGGRERARVEEPVRELVLDLGDRELRRDVVLDARKLGVDLDRGEVLPQFSVGDLRRMAFLAGVDLSLIDRYLPIPDDFFAPIDTAGVAVVGRVLADYHVRRSHQLMLRVPEDAYTKNTRHHAWILQRAETDADAAKRWRAFTRSLTAASL